MVPAAVPRQVQRKGGCQFVPPHSAARLEGETGNATTQCGCPPLLEEGSLGANLPQGWSVSSLIFRGRNITLGRLAAQGIVSGMTKAAMGEAWDDQPQLEDYVRGRFGCPRPGLIEYERAYRALYAAEQAAKEGSDGKED